MKQNHYFYIPVNDDIKMSIYYIIKVGFTRKMACRRHLKGLLANRMVHLITAPRS